MSFCRHDEDGLALGGGRIASLSQPNFVEVQRCPYAQRAIGRLGALLVQVPDESGLRPCHKAKRHFLSPSFSELPGESKFEPLYVSNIPGGYRLMDAELVELIKSAAEPNVNEML